MDNVIDEEVDLKPEDNDIDLYCLSKPDFVDVNSLKVENLYPVESAIVYQSKDASPTDTTINNESISVENVKEENVLEENINAVLSDKSIEPAKELKESQKRVYRCVMCAFETRLRSSLVLHERSHLAPEERQWCRRGSRAKKLKKSQRKVYRCPTCNYQTQYRSSILQHKKVHLAPEERQLLDCPHCEKKYTSKEGLQYHLDNSHIDSSLKEFKKSQKNTYRCTICTYQTPHRFNLNKHKKIHLAPERKQLFACAHCDNKYRSRGGLHYHLKDNHIEVRAKELKESEKMVYRCSTCDYQTRHKTLLKQHGRSHLAPEERQLFTCEHCDKQYMTKHGLTDHLKDNHIDSRSKKSQENVYRCSICSYETRHISKLKQHKKVHLAPEERQLFACAHCDNKYRSKCSLQYHLNNNHIDLRLTEVRKNVCICTTCGFQTLYKSSLRKHQKLHLAPEERQLFACEQCDKIYLSNQGLQDHIKRGHIDSRYTVTDEVKLDSLKIEVDDPLLEDFKNAELPSVTNEVKSEDVLKTEPDDVAPFLNTDIKTENLSVAKKEGKLEGRKLEDFVKMEIDEDIPVLDLDERKSS